MNRFESRREDFLNNCHINGTIPDDFIVEYTNNNSAKIVIGGIWSGMHWFCEEEEDKFFEWNEESY